MKRSWHRNVRQTCLLVLTPVAVFHFLTFPIGHIQNEESHDIPSSITLSQWNSGPLEFYPGQIKGAAMMLVSKPWTSQRGERQCYFNASLTSLQQNWYPTNPYPIILQHPDGWSEAEIHDIKTTWPNLPLYFSKLGRAFHTDIPPQLEDDEKPLSPLGYKKMCAYKTYGFLKAPYVHTLDYLFHIDDDACLTEPIPYDVFATMKHHKIAYAYKQLFLDREYVVHGLSDFVQEFVDKMKLSYANPSLQQWLQDHHYLEKSSSNDHWTFSTNLEFLHVQQWRQPKHHPIQQFHQALESSKIIFHRRWGDAPLRFILSYLFWNNQQVWRLCQGYVHSLWQPSESTCSKDDDSGAMLRIQDAVLNHLKECVPKSVCD